MIDSKKVAELRKAQNFSKLSWMFGNDSAKDILDTIEALWKENAELKDLLTGEGQCGHKAKFFVCNVCVEKLEAVAKAAEVLKDCECQCPIVQDVMEALAALREGEK